jgi:hypothetical protein
MVTYIQDQFPGKLKSIDRKKLPIYYVNWPVENSGVPYDYCDIIDVHFNPQNLGGLDQTRNQLVAFNDNPATKKTKPRINNENYWPDTIWSVWPSKVAWTTFVGGGHYQRHTGFWRNGYIPKVELEDLEALKKFVHNTNFWLLKPDDGFFDPVNNCPSASVHGMSDIRRSPETPPVVIDPREYVFYIALSDGAEVTQDYVANIPLTVESSSYPVCFYAEWYLPEVGIGSFRPPAPNPLLVFTNNQAVTIGIPAFKDHIAFHMKRVECN